MNPTPVTTLITNEFISLLPFVMAIPAVLIVVRIFLKLTRLYDLGDSTGPWVDDIERDWYIDMNRANQIRQTRRFYAESAERIKEIRNKRPSVSTLPSSTIHYR